MATREVFRNYWVSAGSNIFERHQNILSAFKIFHPFQLFLNIYFIFYKQKINHICLSFILEFADLKFIYSEKATKFCEISPLLLSYVVPVKSKVEISQKFLAFSEYMNFNNQSKISSWMGSGLWILLENKTSATQLYWLWESKIFSVGGWT